ncbi:MAG: GSCFA domain-containing protein [Pseudomonadota bacterium]
MARAQQVSFQSTSRHGKEFRTWFRGEHMNVNPTRARMVAADGVPKYVVKGWEPDEPFITEKTQITAFGSCFAANISNWLSKRNFRVLTRQGDPKRAYVIACGEGMVNSFVIRQQFEWAWENKTYEQPLWHGYKAEDYGYDPAVQAETKRIFDETDVFILTFGLSEVWYDEPTGNVFWRTIPKDVYDPSRHKFRVSTVEENRENLEAIYQLIRKHRPDAKVIFTLSPIPLIATFRDNSCLTSNSVSKAVLRVAIDETVRKHRDEGVLHYWPSYEIVTDVFRLPYKPDRRHPYTITLDYIMTLFEHTWCVPGEAPRPSVLQAWMKAGSRAGILPASFGRIATAARYRPLRAMLTREAPLDEDPKTDAALRKMLEQLRAEWNEHGLGVSHAVSLEDAEEDQFSPFETPLVSKHG